MKLQQLPSWKKTKLISKPLQLVKFSLAKRVSKMYPQTITVGVTGSVGKSTTLEFCQSVLSQKSPTLSSHTVADPIMDVMNNLLKVRSKYKFFLSELVLQHPQDVLFYTTLLQPKIGIVTRVSDDFPDGFSNHGHYLADLEKLIEYFPKDGFAILNWDDAAARKLAQGSQAEVLFYGTDAKNCHVWAEKIHIHNYQTIFHLNYGVERVDVTLKLLGRHWVTSALAAASLGITQGMNLMTIKRGLEKVEPLAHRLVLQEGLENCLVIDDTHNADPLSIEESLNVIKEIPAKRRVVVLGPVKTSAAFNNKTQQHLAQKIYKDNIDFVMTVGSEMQTLIEELLALGYPQDSLLSNPSHSQIVAFLLRFMRKGDIVLVKGAPSSKLDEVVQRITKHDV